MLMLSLLFYKKKKKKYDVARKEGLIKRMGLKRSKRAQSLLIRTRSINLFPHKKKFRLFQT